MNPHSAMTVAELRDALADIDPTLPVVADDGDGSLFVVGYVLSKVNLSNVTAYVGGGDDDDVELDGEYAVLLPRPIAVRRPQWS